MLKYGSVAQKTMIVEKIKPFYLDLMTNKYSHYLASKTFLYAPDVEQKNFLRRLVMAEINKHIIHSVTFLIVHICLFSMHLRLLNTSICSHLRLNKERWCLLSMEITFSF